VPDVWLEAYGAICAQAQGLRYFKRLPVYTYLGISEENYGTQVASDAFDALIYLDYDRIRGRSGLGFARRDGAVWTAGQGPRLERISADGGLDTVNGLLTWRVRLGAGPSITRIAVSQRGAADAVFEVGVLAPAEARGLAVLLVQSEGRTLSQTPVSGLGPGTIQGVRVPLHLAVGHGDITLVILPTSKSPPGGVDLMFVNPRLFAESQPAQAVQVRP